MENFLNLFRKKVVATTDSVPTNKTVTILKEGRETTNKKCMLQVTCERCGCEFMCDSSYGDYKVYTKFKFFWFKCPSCKETGSDTSFRTLKEMP